jgi:hypothetical protein
MRGAPPINPAGRQPEPQADIGRIMSGKRTTLKWRVARVGVAIVLLVSTNVGAYAAWHRVLPWAPLFPENQAASTEVFQSVPATADATYVGAQPANARELVQALLDVSPTPSGNWRVLTDEPENLLSGPVASCLPSPRHIPGLQGQRVWAPLEPLETTPATPSPSPSTAASEGPSEPPPPPAASLIGSGISMQVLVYHAGVGPLAFAQLRNSIAACYSGVPWRLEGISTLYFAQESFSAILSNTNGTQGITVFRYGDILGVVASREADQSDTLASQWAMRWVPLAQKICLNLANTATDARRQPLLRGLYKPYTEANQIRLSDTVKLTVQQQESSAARPRALKAVSVIQSELDSTPYSIPGTFLAPATQPRDRPGERVPTTDEPASEYGLSVVLPQAPTRPELPTFPNGFRETRTISGPVFDKDGPGCGWGLLSQAPPSFNAATADQVWSQKRAEAVGELEEDYSRWVKQTWDYAIAYQAYLSRAQVWNAWATVAALRVAEVDWRHYDILLEQYESEVKAYQVALDAVLRCEKDLAAAIREREELFDNPSPSPSVPGDADPPPPPPLPPLPQCEQRPAPPEVPVTPTRERPPNMQRG